jgi:hypothetical protein
MLEGELSEQMFWFALTVPATDVGLTVTTAAPLFPEPAHPSALVTDTKVYVFVELGETDIPEPVV